MERHGFRESSRDKAPAKGRLWKKIEALNRFVDGTGPKLSHVDFRVWMTMFRHARDGLVTRAHGQMASDIGVSERTVRRAIERLHERKLVRLVSRGGLHVGASTYRLGVRDLRAPKGVPEAVDAAAPEPSSTGHGCPVMADIAVSDITDDRDGTTACRPPMPPAGSELNSERIPLTS